jgi:DNA-binding LacI/PurR family transcriptional regulator
MHEAALEHNKIVATFAYSNEEMASKFSHRRVPAVFLRSNVEGMLLSGSMDEQLMNRVNEVRLPHVFMNVNDAHRQPCDSISFNEDHCGRLATEHLLHLGHRNLVHVSLDNPDGGRHYSTRHRRRAFESTVSDAGVRGRVVFYDRNADDPLAHLRAILKDADRPTAIFAYNNQLTLATYRVLSELGLSCRDVGLVGVQWQSEYEVQELRINHVALPAPEMGKLAFEALMRKISGEKDLPAIELRGTLVESASVFPVSSP